MKESQRKVKPIRRLMIVAIVFTLFIPAGIHGNNERITVKNVREGTRDVRSRQPDYEE